MKELLKALSDFQEECPPFVKDTEGYGYKYVQLPDIMKVITPLLRKHGLILIQRNGNKEDMVGVETTLMHMTTEKAIASSLYMPLTELAKMNLYQVAGSAITYIRRYDISTLLGLQSEKDADGAGEPAKRKVKRRGVTASPVVTAPTKELLSPDTTNWQKAIDYMAKPDADINIVAKNYNISKEHLELLKK